MEMQGLWVDQTFHKASMTRRDKLFAAAMATAYLGPLAAVFLLWLGAPLYVGITLIWLCAGAWVFTADTRFDRHYWELHRFVLVAGWLWAGGYLLWRVLR